MQPSLPRRIRMHAVFLALLFAFAATPPALAQQDTDQLVLTPAKVEAFLAARDPLEELARTLSRLYGDRSENVGDAPILSLEAYEDVPEARQRIEALLRQHGFTDLAEWNKVQNSVLMAYQFVDPANVPADVEAEKNKARAEIEADKSLDEAARQQALAQLETQYAALGAATPLPGNVDVVRPFAGRIRPMVERD